MRLIVNAKKNSPQLWDKVWDSQPTKNEDIFQLKLEENSIRWRKIEREIITNFGSFSNLSVIEIGAGSGTNAALMAKRGANVTILDYSGKAIERSKRFFENNDLYATHIHQDALRIKPNLIGKFDIAMSFGLTEHFIGDLRREITDIHFKLIKSGGLVIISVPNKHCIPYRIYKHYLEFTGDWNVGEEYPYSRKELYEIAIRNKTQKYSIFGGSFYSSFNKVIPRPIIKKYLKRQITFNFTKNDREFSSPFDDYFSYSLILCGKK